MQRTDMPVDAGAIHQHAVRSLFQMLESICEGAVVVDREARIVWISDKYRVLLGLRPDAPVLGKAIEEVIPTSQMRHVVGTGEPIVLDIMDFKDQSREACQSGLFPIRLAAKPLMI